MGDLMSRQPNSYFPCLVTKDTAVSVARIIRLSQPQIWIGWQQKAFASLMDLRLSPLCA